MVLDEVHCPRDNNYQWKPASHAQHSPANCPPARTALWELAGGEADNFELHTLLWKFDNVVYEWSQINY